MSTLKRALKPSEGYYPKSILQGCWHTTKESLLIYIRSKNDKSSDDLLTALEKIQINNSTLNNPGTIQKIYLKLKYICCFSKEFLSDNMSSHFTELWLWKSFWWELKERVKLELMKNLLYKICSEEWIDLVTDKVGNIEKDTHLKITKTGPMNVISINFNEDHEKFLYTLSNIIANDKNNKIFQNDIENLTNVLSKHGIYFSEPHVKPSELHWALKKAVDIKNRFIKEHYNNNEIKDFIISQIQEPREGIDYWVKTKNAVSDYLFEKVLIHEMQVVDLVNSNGI